MDKYSIIIPVYNEINCIHPLLNSLEPFISKGHEIIIINDGSTDGSAEVLKGYKSISLINIAVNRGKGYAIKKGLEKVRYEKVVIFDGDMEIDPSEISKLMILDSESSLNYVMGYRFNALSMLKSDFDFGNFMFTSFFNILFQSNYKDVLCCAKAFYSNKLKGTKLSSDGFDIDVELSSIFSIQKRKGDVAQVFIRYKRRSFNEGKKLKVPDGWVILSRIIKMIKYF